MAARFSKFLGTVALCAGACAGTSVALAAQRPAPRKPAVQRAAPAPAPAAQQQQSAPAAPATPAAPNSTANLRLPTEVMVFGNQIPSVVKASAIVNGEVITQTDIDQRLALVAISQGGEIPANEVERLRAQILSNLIDETLEIQAAKREDIKVASTDIDRTVARVAQNIKQTPDQMAAFLKSKGSSIRSMRRQIEGEIAWQRYQRAKIESGINVGEDEVKAVIDRLNASRGKDEYHVGEIYLNANSTNDAQVQANMQKIYAALQQGGSFVGYARQFSEASTAAVGGDLGWVRPEQLPEPLANALPNMRPNSITPPIRVNGGYSILALLQSRKVLTNDPRNAELSLKQVSITFPKGTTRQTAEPILARFSAAARNVGGCGGAEKLAADFKGDVVSSDAVKLNELPAVLQDMMLPMQVGQATQPFGNIEEGVRVLVICGRDEGQSQDSVNPEQVQQQMVEERVNLRARRYLRDMRRDAVIDYR